MRHSRYESMDAKRAVAMLATSGDTPAGVVGIARVTLPHAGGPTVDQLRVLFDDGAEWMVCMETRRVL